MRDSSSQRPILVYGAAGHTASFVVSSLRSRGHKILPGGRSADRLRQTFPDVPASDLRIFDLVDPEGAERALAGVSMVVNCAGPFADTTEHLLEAALKAGAHYLDIGAEQAVARVVLEDWNDRAKGARVVAIPAMGFYGGLGDLLATAAMGDWTGADEIALYFALDSWHPTAGTRRTVRRNAGRHLVFSDGELRSPPETAPRMRWRFPGDFGRQEMVGFTVADAVTISSHLRAKNVPGWINETPIADLGNAQTPAPVAVDDTGRSAQRFTLQVVVTRGHAESTAVASGQDIYAVTGPLVAEAATRILAQERTNAGAFAAGKFFDARQFLLALSPQPLSLTL